ncbi:MAG: XRE family transcriptional regulator, partial [Clostridia bacterium]|nr:XRE family transcriptional regulator [Clostridia bacterium]
MPAPSHFSESSLAFLLVGLSTLVYIKYICIASVFLKIIHKNLLLNLNCVTKEIILYINRSYKGRRCVVDKNFFKREAVPEMLKQRRMSLREFSTRAGLSSSSVSAWLRGAREPKLSNIRKMAQALNCKVSDISEYGEGALDWTDELPAEPPLPATRDTIRNTSELRECIKDA